MIPTAAELEGFEERGFLLRPSVFAAEEVAALEAALPAAIDPERANVVVDGTSGTVRMVHGAHRHTPALARLARHPRLVRPAERLLGGPVYVYQSRLNLKEGLRDRPSGGYPWHQDFSTWHFRDGLPEPRAVVVFTFLDPVDACNAPLMVFPGSHREGIFEAGERPEGGDGYTQLQIAPDTLRRLAAEGGLIAVTGGPGSVLFMHSNLVHGSTENLSPLRRALYSVVYSALDNRPHSTTASEHYAARSFEPVEPLADDCLTALDA